MPHKQSEWRFSVPTWAIRFLSLAPDTAQVNRAIGATLPLEVESRQHTLVEDTENFYPHVSGRIENTVGFHRILKIAANIWVKASAQPWISRKIFKGLLNVVDILFSPSKAKLLHTVIKDIFEVAVRPFVNIKGRMIRHCAFSSSEQQSYQHSNPQ